MIEIGDAAPDFTASIAEDKVLSLSDLRGKNVVLYFYPKDKTPGCSLEACGFNAHLDQFAKLNVVVVGVSRDSILSHQKFRESYNLNFDLVSDDNSEICKKYEVLETKSMFGKKYIGIVRSTFLIDISGKILKIWRNVSVISHVNNVLKETELLLR